MRTRASGESALLLLDAVAVLSARSIDYAVIGAMAAAVHGVVRASMDADVVLSLAVREAHRLRDALSDAGFSVELRRGDFGDPIPALLEVKDTFANRVDLLVGLKGMDSAVFTRAIQVPFSGEMLKVVGREDFVAMKLFAGGPLDLLDARNVSSLDPEGLDVELVRRLAQSYGSEAVSNFQALFPTPAL
jgi:hypothetical protein